MASSFGRLAKTTSCVLRNDSAASEEETTIVGTCPSRRDMTGPYVLAKDSRVRCGSFPNMWRLPMTGKPDGPGGGLRSSLVCFGRKNKVADIRMNVNVEKSTRARGVEGNIA